MSPLRVDRTGQVWEDVLGARVSSGTTAPIEDYEGPFLVVTTDPELNLHRCAALRTGRQFALGETTSRRWEDEPWMERLA